MREVDCEDVAAHDQGDLQVPDERGVDDAYVRLVADGAEGVPASPEWVGDEGEDEVPLREQVREVVGRLVDESDGHQRVRERPGERGDAGVPEHRAELHHARIEAEKGERHDHEAQGRVRGAAQQCARAGD